MAKRKRRKRTSKQDISYADISIIPLPPNLLSDIPDQNGVEQYCVLVDREILKTPKGYPIRSNYRAIRELAAELEYSDKLEESEINLYGLFSSQIDFVERTDVSFTFEQIDFGLLNDPVLRTSAGPEVMMQQMKYLQAVEQYLKEQEIDYPHLPQIPFMGRFWDMGDGEKAPLFSDEGEDNFNKLNQYVTESIDEFNVYQKTVYVTSGAVFGSPILSLMLAQLRLSPHEFAVIYLTSLGLNSKVWRDIDRTEERNSLRKITNDVELMQRYLNQVTPKLSEVEKLIKSGESTKLEFKSTLRWNIYTGKRDPAMEHAVLKSITAFMNSDGGTLLVGVQDDGMVLGIDPDFPNEDKYLLHFSNLFNGKIGKQYSEWVTWGLVSNGNKKILKVDCLKSPMPIFLKYNKNQEEFFIRTGPATVQLSASEVLEYSKRHFN